MSDGDNITGLLAPDNYTLPPGAGSLSPSPGFPTAPSPSPGLSPSPGFSPSSGFSPSPGISPSPSPGPGPTAGGLAGSAVAGAGASPFPPPWAPLEPAFWDTPLSHGLNVLVGAALCVAMLGLGCTVDAGRFGAHVRRPLGALLAALCQFGLLLLHTFWGSNL